MSCRARTTSAPFTNTYSIPVGLSGGRIVAAGPPETVAQAKGSYTGQYLAPYLARAAQKAKKRA